MELRGRATSIVKPETLNSDITRMQISTLTDFPEWD
jgi:hypothetical protein